MHAVQVLGRDAVLPVSTRGRSVHVLHEEKARPASRLGCLRQGPGAASGARQEEKHERERHVEGCSLVSTPIFGVPGNGTWGTGGVQVPVLLPGALHADVSPLAVARSHSILLKRLLHETNMKREEKRVCVLHVSRKKLEFFFFEKGRVRVGRVRAHEREQHGGRRTRRCAS